MIALSPHAEIVIALTGKMMVISLPGAEIQNPKSVSPVHMPTFETFTDGSITAVLVQKCIFCI